MYKQPNTHPAHTYTHKAYNGQSPHNTHENGVRVVSRCHAALRNTCSTGIKRSRYDSRYGSRWGSSSHTFRASSAPGGPPSPSSGTPTGYSQLTLRRRISLSASVQGNGAHATLRADAHTIQAPKEPSKLKNTSTYMQAVTQNATQSPSTRACTTKTPSAWTH